MKSHITPKIKNLLEAENMDEARFDFEFVNSVEPKGDRKTGQLYYAPEIPDDWLHRPSSFAEVAKVSIFWAEVFQELKEPNDQWWTFAPNPPEDYVESGSWGYCLVREGKIIYRVVEIVS